MKSLLWKHQKFSSSYFQKTKILIFPETLRGASNMQSQFTSLEQILLSQLECPDCMEYIRPPFTLWLQKWSIHVCTGITDVWKSKVLIWLVNAKRNVSTFHSHVQLRSLILDTVFWLLFAAVLSHIWSRRTLVCVWNTMVLVKVQFPPDVSQVIRRIANFVGWQWRILHLLWNHECPVLFCPAVYWSWCKSC